MTKRKSLRERASKAADAYADKACGRVKPGTAKGRQWLVVWGAHFDGRIDGYRAAQRDAKAKGCAKCGHAGRAKKGARK